MEAENNYNAIFAQAMTGPSLMGHTQFTTPPPSTIDPSSTTIKMEDFSSAMSYSSSLPPTSHPATPGTPSHSTDGKPHKKRKSWGQVLPEPKTNLPPRKRAKTDDEKEQRRIERVKRNRLAAHNSRERKRQEVEQLQHEKDQLAVELENARAAMARMAAKLKALESGKPLDQSFDASSTVDDYDLILAQETINPRQTSFPSPVSMDSLDSPRDESCQPETPAYTESLVTELDQTRYPAAILCDLQCQSSSRPRSLQLQATLAYLTLFQLTLLPSMRSLLTIFSTSTLSQIPNWNTQALTWWKTQTSSPALSSTTPPTLMAFLTRLMQSTPSTCRQPLAQRLPLATRLSQRRRSSIDEVARPSVKEGRVEKEGTAGNRRSSHRFRQGRRQQELLALKPHLKRWLDTLEVQNHDFQGRQEES